MTNSKITKEVKELSNLFLLISMGLLTAVGCTESDNISPDPCAYRNCPNNLFCIDGNCVCPDGYKAYNRNCVQISPSDFVLSGISGDTSCFSDYYVLTKLPQPLKSVDTIPFPVENWEVVRFRLYRKGRLINDTLAFNNDDPDDDELPIRGDASRTYTYSFDFSCENVMEPEGLFVKVNRYLYYTEDTIRIDAEYIDPITEESLGVPTNYSFTRYGN